MRTMAMQRATPTRMRPFRRPGLSGRKAQDRASMRKGATIQFRRMEKVIWSQVCLVRRARCRDSYFTAQRIGYIIVRRPMAMGMETEAKCPVVRVVDMRGTKFPRRMPVAMARRIQRARKRSRRPRAWKADWGLVGGGVCFSGSEGGEMGASRSVVGMGWVIVSFGILVEGDGVSGWGFLFGGRDGFCIGGFADGFLVFVVKGRITGVAFSWYDIVLDDK